MMRGTVKMINATTGMMAVEIDGEYSLLELLEVAPNLDLGDVIEGPLDSLGLEDVRNVTKGETWHVCVQDAYCDLATAREKLFV